MNSMVHLAGILAALWLAYVCLVEIGGYKVLADSTTVGGVPASANAICVSNGVGFADAGMLRIAGDIYDYSRKYTCSELGDGTPGGTGLQLQNAVTSSMYDPGVEVAQVVEPVLSQARYLGWAFVVVALMLIPALIIAMRYDYVHPVGGDV